MEPNIQEESKDVLRVKEGYFFDLTKESIPPLKTIDNLSEDFKKQNINKFDVNEVSIFLNIYNGTNRFNLENTKNTIPG